MDTAQSNGGICESYEIITIDTASVGMDNENSFDTEGFSLAKIDERVASLEAWVKMGGTIVAASIVGWLAFISIKVFSISENLAKIDQAMKDKGIELVRQIEKPSSPLQQRAALLVATDGLKRAAIEKVTPNPAKLAALSVALATASKEPIPPQEVWPAVTTLVSYRSQLIPVHTENPVPNCWNEILIRARGRVDQPGEGIRIDGIGDCQIDLNDIDSFEAVRAQQRQLGASASQIDNIYIHMVGARVVYDPNKPVVPLRQFTCQVCRISVVEPAAEPSLKNRQMLQAFLSSKPEALMYLDSDQPQKSSSVS